MMLHPPWLSLQDWNELDATHLLQLSTPRVLSTTRKHLDPSRIPLRQAKPTWNKSTSHPLETLSPGWTRVFYSSGRIPCILQIPSSSNHSTFSFSAFSNPVFSWEEQKSFISPKRFFCLIKGLHVCIRSLSAHCPK